MNEKNQSRRAPRLLGACLVALTVLCRVSSAEAVVTIKVATEDGMPGGTVRMALSMTREGGEGSVATMNADVIYNIAQLDLVGNCGNGDPCRTTADCGEDDFCRFTPTACEKDPRLTEQTVEVTPPDFQNVQPGLRRIRFAVVATRLPVPTFGDGNLVTCTFQVPQTAPLGQQTLSTDRLQVADNSIPARPLPSVIVVEAGSIVPGTAPTPTTTMSGTPGGGSPTPTNGGASPTPTGGTPGGGSPTPTPTGPVVCPEPRPAPAGPALYVEDQNLDAIGDATITIRLATGGAQVAGTQSDIGSTGNVVIKARANGRPDCAVNPAIDKSGTSFAFRPPGCTAGTCNAVRALVLSTENTSPIADGSVLFTCNVTVSGGGSTVAVTGVIMSNPVGQRVDGVTGRDGEICVNSSVTPTVRPTGTRTPTNGVGSATPTRTNTPPTVVATTARPTATLTPPSASPTARNTATSTPKSGSGGGGGGGGCNCNIEGGRVSSGASAAWLILPAAILVWRRRGQR